MNSFLADNFAEHVDRLMLGIESLDALRGARVAMAINVVLDGNPAAARAPNDANLAWQHAFGVPDAIGGLQPIPRHNSCRHALLFKPGLKSPVTIRLYDPQRRFAPRRISYPVPADINATAPRVRRPALYPGAAYAISEASTGLRGRVTWSRASLPEVPVRWVRVIATLGGQVVGRAHGDERGEFLLLLNSDAGGLGDLPSPLSVLVTVFGPPAALPVPANDPLGDLPLEALLVDPDDVSAGEKLPPAYVSTALSSRAVDFELGRLLTQQDKFFFNP